MPSQESTERARGAAIFFAAITGGVFVTALAFFFIYQIRAVLPPFIYALIIVYVLRPLVDSMVVRNIPRIIAVSLVYLLVFIGVAIFSIFLMPIALTQVGELIKDFPDYLKVGLKHFSELRIAYYRIHFPSGIEPLVEEVSIGLKSSALRILSGLPETTVGFVGGIFNLVLAPIIAFYILKDLPAIRETMISLFPARYRDEFLHVLKEIDTAVGGYLRGQVLVSLVVGVSIGVYLLAIGVNFAVLLGLLAGVLNIIPYFGPVLGGATAAIVALFESPMLALKVVIGMAVIQQVDSAIISPSIMKHAVNLHPVAIVFALLVGGTLFGFLGLLLAIPVASLAKALLLHYVFAQPVEIAEEG